MLLNVTCIYVMMGRDSSIGIASPYGLDGPGSSPGGGKIFRTRPDRPWGPTSLLYNGYRVFPGGKVRPGGGVDHPTPSSAEVKKKNRAITLLPLWAFVACSRVKFTFKFYMYVMNVLYRNLLINYF